MWPGTRLLACRRVCLLCGRSDVARNAFALRADALVWLGTHLLACRRVDLRVNARGVGDVLFACAHALTWLGTCQPRADGLTWVGTRKPRADGLRRVGMRVQLHTYRKRVSTGPSELRSSDSPIGCIRSCPEGADGLTRGGHVSTSRVLGTTGIDLQTCQSRDRASGSKWLVKRKKEKNT